MHDLIEFLSDLDEPGAWILSKTILAVWYWLFPRKDIQNTQSRSPQ